MENTTPIEPSHPTVQELIADLAKIDTPSGKGFNEAAIKRLAAIGPAAIEPLIEATRVGTSWTRASAAMALGAIGDDRPSVVEALRQMWLDSDQLVSFFGRMALTRLPHPTEPELAKRLNQGTSEILRKIRERAWPNRPET